MEEKKVIKALVINSATCDAREVQESALEGYDKIVINSGLLLSNARSNEILNKYPVICNVGNTLDVASDVQVSTFNGKAEIKPGIPAPNQSTYLTVNGTLEVAPGSEEILKTYCGFTINGTVICPESLSGYFSSAQINGTLLTYPDDCIRLKNTTVLDRTFPLRAKQDAKYYASRRVVALDSGIDFAKLAEKNVQFVTKKLLIAEGLAEAALPLFDEQAEVLILPDGCAFVNGGSTLDEALLRRYGGKLYINGDLTVNRQSAPLLDQMEYLQVNGDIRAVKSMVEPFRAIRAEYNQIKIVGGTTLTDKVSLTVDRRMLEQAEDGLSIFDCVNLKFREDVPAELIQEKLVSLSDCVNISCTPEQRGVIELVSSDVVQIDDSGRGIVKQAGTFLDGIFEQMGVEGSFIDKAKSLLGSKVINAANYKF